MVKRGAQRFHGVIMHVVSRGAGRAKFRSLLTQLEWAHHEMMVAMVLGALLRGLAAFRFFCINPGRHQVFYEALRPTATNFSGLGSEDLALIQTISAIVEKIKAIPLAGSELSASTPFQRSRTLRRWFSSVWAGRTSGKHSIPG